MSARKLAISLTWDQWQRISEVLGTFNGGTHAESLRDTWNTGERKQYDLAFVEISRVMLRGEP